jgi:hypothetical protein
MGRRHGIRGGALVQALDAMTGVVPGSRHHSVRTGGFRQSVKETTFVPVPGSSVPSHMMGLSITFLFATASHIWFVSGQLVSGFS